MAAKLTVGVRGACREECRQLWRQPWDLFFITLLPVLMLVLLAWVFSAGGMRGLPIAVVDGDHSADSRLLLRMLDASAGIEVVLQAQDLPQAFAATRQLQVFAVVAVPRDFSRQLHRGQVQPLTVYYNASYLAPGQSAMRDIADAVAAFNARVLVEQVAAQAGPARLRPAPVRVLADILHNRARSYALFLLPLVFAALLSLCSALAMTAALGRELRDGRLATWLGARPLAAIAGKLLPYVLLFSAYGTLATGWVLQTHGSGISVAGIGLLLFGQCLLHAASAALALLFVGLTRDMGTALSMIGLSVGTSLAFSGATFPVIDAPLFTQVWSALLPLSAYVQLQTQQLLAGAPLLAAWPALLSLLAIIVIATGLGGWRLLAARPAGNGAGR